MGEAGVDISNHVSEWVDPILEQCFDYVITICDRAQATEAYEQQVTAFRNTRDEIADRIRHFITESLF